MKRFSRTVVQFSDDPTFSDVETEETTTLRARVAELEEALSELANLMDEVRAGDYFPDSFTTQPAHKALAGGEEEK